MDYTPAARRIILRRWQDEMKTIHEEAWYLPSMVIAVLVVYIVGYGVLYSLDYFDLAALPWNPHTDAWLYQIYRPLEWLRHLW